MQITGDITLKKGRESSVQRFHPWVFSGAVQTVADSLTDGDWARVTDQKGKTLGYGHYQKGTITVRILSFGEPSITTELWSAKIIAAYSLRASTAVISSSTNAYRLIHGEADGLSGLIIDVYNGVGVIQSYTEGMHRDRHDIASALKEVLGKEIHSIYYKRSSSPKSEGQHEYLLGMGAVPHIITEHDHRFFVDWEEGQKTGFFLDQRENRKLLSNYAHGRTVLNTFCYTGGFSVYALMAGARLVHSVDASEKAIELTNKNIELNGFSPNEHRSFAIDTFEYLKDKSDEYDLIVLDPPAFAKHKDARHQAMKGYQRLNAEAIRKIKSGGIIFTFSCSQVVNRQLFYDTVVSAALQAEREVKVLQHLSQPADHPVSMYHPEGEYLKGLVLYVA